MTDSLPESELDKLEYEAYIDEIYTWDYEHEIDLDELHRFFTYNQQIIEYLDRNQLAQVFAEALHRLEDLGEL